MANSRSLVGQTLNCGVEVKITRDEPEGKGSTDPAARRILLENYFLPGDLKQQIERFVEHYNYQRYHESLNNLTPADGYFGRGQSILAKRERIKRKTIAKRRLPCLASAQVGQMRLIE